MASKTKDQVLEVLAGQSPDYLIQPDASAFQARGLAPTEVAEALAELTTEGHALLNEVVAMERVPKMVPLTRIVFDPDAKREVEVPVEDGKGRPALVVVPNEFETNADGDLILVEAPDKNGNPYLLDKGWQITDSGRQRTRRTK